jgi:hypothetical protein
MSWQLVANGDSNSAVKAAFDPMMANEWNEGLIVLSKEGSELVHSMKAIDEETTDRMQLYSSSYEINVTLEDIELNTRQRILHEERELLLN